MKWTVRIIQGLLVVGFLLSGFMKLSADPMQVQSFNEIYNYGTGLMYVVGSVEVISAVGLFIGFWKKNLVPVFSGALIIVMAGAVFTHLKAGQGFGVAMIPFVLLVLAVIVFFGQRKLNANQK
jgi:putative oxidoreductase